MAKGQRRPFSTWLADVVCALIAFGIARGVRVGFGGSLWEQLPQDLVTFVAVYVALRLTFKLIAIQNERAAREADTHRAAAAIAKKVQEKTKA